MNPDNKNFIRVRALLDSGCSRDLINPVLVTGLGLGVRELDEAIIFEQMDGSPMKGDPCAYETVPVRLGMGDHWELNSFVIAPTAKYPVILNCKWLKRHDPMVCWKDRVLSFKSSSCASHKWDQNWGSFPFLEGVTVALPLTDLLKLKGKVRQPNSLVPLWLGPLNVLLPFVL